MWHHKLFIVKLNEEIYSNVKIKEKYVDKTMVVFLKIMTFWFTGFFFSFWHTRNLYHFDSQNREIFR